MKKLLKSKVSLFGKQIPVFAIVAIGLIALASAALVPYLSNAVTTTVGVSSPIDLKVANRNEANWGNSLTLSGTFGGSEFSYDLRSQYFANKESGIIFMTTLVANSINDAGCEDFEKLEVTSPTPIHFSESVTIPANTPVDVLQYGLCNTVTDDGSTYAKISIPAKFGYSSGDNDQTFKIDGKFKLNVAPSIYDITTQAMITAP
jgi:hypothetical protein